jgi:hypothetical protein
VKIIQKEKRKIMKFNKSIIRTLGILSLMIAATILFNSCEEEEFSDQNITMDLRDGGTTDADCYLLDPAPTLTEQEEEMILFMREEEKLARDVYTVLFEEYNLNVFNNISKSEQQHMDRIACLIDFYELTDPVQSDIGVFTNTELQTLYNTLIELGMNSLEDALSVGATIEDVDIYDLEEHIQYTENPAIIQIFENLTCGSRNHIRAFTSQLAKYNISYEAQFISAEELADILAADREPCGKENANGDCDGAGNGKGGNGKGGNGKGGNGDCDGSGSGSGNKGGNGDCDGSGSGNKGGNGNNSGNGECDGSGSGNNGGNGGNGDGGNGGNGDGGNGGNGDGGNGDGGNGDGGNGGNGNGGNGGGN